MMAISASFESLNKPCFSNYMFLPSIPFGPHSKLRDIAAVMIVDHVPPLEELAMLFKCLWWSFRGAENASAPMNDSKFASGPS
jgi:hypothetical protein